MTKMKGARPEMGKPKLGVAVIRTDEKVAELKAKLEDELAHLPDINFFGEDNTEVKEELRVWIGQLDNYMSEGVLPPVTGEDDMYFWLTNTKSLIGKDYGVE